ncbi:50S ribosomal protein L4, partial [Patescibacteria group bacterium]|nr:50S ribosomal protein L4 [Patescibacteria group bacterium]
GLESYPDTIKTKDMFKLLTKLPVDIGRRILFVTSGKHEGICLSLRNVPKAEAVQAMYLNPERVLGARHIVFLVDAVKKVEEVFGGKEIKAIKEVEEKKEIKEVKEVKEKKPAKKSTSTKTK